MPNPQKRIEERLLVLAESKSKRKCDELGYRRIDKLNPLDSWGRAKARLCEVTVLDLAGQSKNIHLVVVAKISQRPRRPETQLYCDACLSGKLKE